jgi:phosphoglycolate phosphatase
MNGHAVFDLDGALIDSVPLFTTILNAMLADRGHSRRVDDAAVRPHASAGGRAMASALLSGADVDRDLAEFRERYAALPTPQDCLYPGVRDGLAQLKTAGIRLALWSSKTQPLCDKVMSELGLTPLFDAIVGTSAEVPLKPDPTGLVLALSRAGGTRDRSCFVGDSEADYRCARAAGVAIVILTYGYGAPDQDYPGARLAHRFSDVPPIVEGILGLSRGGAPSLSATAVA